MARALDSLALLAVALLALTAPVLAQAPAPQYRLKESAAPIGSAIRGYGVESSSLPLNLPYGQLTREQQRQFHENYEAIAEGDEPPFPRLGLQALLGPILKAQERWAVRGELTLVATVDEQGVAQEVRALGASNPAMVQFASQVMLVTAYEPAVCGGQACRMDFPLHVKFKLK